MEWIPEGGRRKVGRPIRTWQDTLKEDLETMGVDRSDARDTASDRAKCMTTRRPMFHLEREELSLSK